MAIYYKTNTQIRREAQQKARSVRRVVVALVAIILVSSLVDQVMAAVQTVQGAAL